MSFFLQGLTLGLAYVAPIGMQNMFIINSALNNTRRRAFLTALIVLFFDITLSLACFFGIGRVMELFPKVEMVILGVGSLLVLYIGAGLIRAKAETQGEYRPMTIRKTISEAGIVTWINPQAILDGTMLLGSFQVTLSASQQTLSASQQTPFLSGVLLASCVWFIFLSGLVSLFRSRFSPRILRAINIICGSVICFYGLKLLFDFASRLS